MTDQAGTAATCKHEAQARLNGAGDMACRKCHWIYRIGLAGSRWVNPKDKPSDG